VRDVTLLNPRDLSPPRGFSHASVLEGLVWLGGQVSSDREGRLLYAGNMPAQFRQALSNMAVALRAAGCRPEGIVKMTYYVTDVEMYRNSLRAIGLAYRDIMGDHYPAASLFEVRGLFDRLALIEIECVAVRGEVRVTRAESLEDEESSGA